MSTTIHLKAQGFLKMEQKVQAKKYSHYKGSTQASHMALPFPWSATIFQFLKTAVLKYGISQYILANSNVADKADLAVANYCHGNLHWNDYCEIFF